MSGKVVHVLGDQSYDVYVGRAVPRKGLKASPFLNPFIIGRDGERGDVLKRFEQYARYCVSMGKDYEIYRGARRETVTYADALRGLRGQTLACWCAPKDRALTVEDETVCHGQILLRLAAE